eukprot:GHVU01173514.1.p1 GENE.GHVU01173514.1~~GHVU01173514.1.p1  ORF type:complete len:155 (-),score=5.53 GHVU01173514.1:869-1333(-)
MYIYTIRIYMRSALMEDRGNPVAACTVDIHVPCACVYLLLACMYLFPLPPYRVSCIVCIRVCSVCVGIHSIPFCHVCSRSGRELALPVQQRSIAAVADEEDEWPFSFFIIFLCLLVFSSRSSSSSSSSRNSNGAAHSPLQVRSTLQTSLPKLRT